MLFHGYSDKRNPRECEDCYCCGDAGSYTELLTGSGGAVWWDYIEGSEYNLSDILLQTASTRADAELPLANAKVSATVEQTICAYGASIGITNSNVLAKFRQTSLLHPVAVNGATGLGTHINITLDVMCPSRIKVIKVEVLMLSIRLASLIVITS